MNRHPFRWQGGAFGAFFLAVAGAWAVWREDLLTPDELSLTLSVVLIVAGAIGVVLTFWRPGRRTAAPTDIPTTPTEDHDGQAAHPQH